MKHFLLFLALVMACAPLGGCDKTKKALGLKRQIPDEFGVLDRAPLSTPPGIGLKPPTPGVARPQEAAPQEKAEKILFNASSGKKKNQTTSSQTSASEDFILKQAQTGERDTEIRKVVDQDASIDTPDEGVVKKILFWQKKEQSADVIDPEEEHKRLHGVEHPGEK